MSYITVTNVQVLENPTTYRSPFIFEISFDCLHELKEDLEWKIIYVGSAESEKYDQVLDSTLVGPVMVGLNKFVFQTEPPNAAEIPDKDVLGVTVVLITASYKGQEFIRIGYYVNNEYDTEELRLSPPEKHDLTKVVRNILADKPRVTRFQIDWDT